VFLGVKFFVSKGGGGVFICYVGLFLRLLLFRVSSFRNHGWRDLTLCWRSDQSSRPPAPAPAPAPGPRPRPPKSVNRSLPNNRSMKTRRITSTLKFLFHWPKPPGCCLRNKGNELKWFFFLCSSSCVREISSSCLFLLSLISFLFVSCLQSASSCLLLFYYYVFPPPHTHTHTNINLSI